MRNIIKQKIVAIVGKPNVGKSTLFNRILGRRQAITSEVAGTTRDRLAASVEWQGAHFILVDTAGLSAPEQDLEKDIINQAKIAIDEADLVVFLVDGQSEIENEDMQVAEILRKANKPVILAVNKAEAAGARSNLGNFYKLGLGEPQPISAIHGTQVAELLDLIKKDLGEAEETAELPEEDIVRVTLAGRPNVGKSTLLNTISGEERAVVSDIPGTTRDAIDMKVEIAGQSYIFIDTAGVRKRGKIGRGIEKFSVLRTLKAIEESDLAVVIIDASEGPVRGDIHIITFALESGKPVVLAINKTDLVPLENVALAKYPFLLKLPLVAISAKTGAGVKKLFELIKNQAQGRD